MASRPRLRLGLGLGVGGYFGLVISIDLGLVGVTYFLQRDKRLADGGGGLLWQWTSTRM